MSKIINELEQYGCNIHSAMERFLFDEDFYEECLKITIQDEGFEKLGIYLNAGNVEEAFNVAHSLKGVTANMNLTPLYNILVEIVEPLRVGKIENLLSIYDKLICEKEKIDNIIKNAD